jgi:hypothetical protein
MVLASGDGASLVGAGEPDTNRTEWPAVTGDSPATGEQDRAQPRFRVGSAPDSWGVWYRTISRQTPWTRFLDELGRAGYEWLELGPYGYLPTDIATLRSELEARSLRLAGRAVGGPLYGREELLPIR